MSELFLSLFNRSVSAIWLILAVAALRLLLQKAPKNIRCLLWAVVALRLILPFSIQSVFSLIPSAQIIPPEYLEQNTLRVSTGLNYVNSHVNDYLGSHYYEGVTVPTGFLNRLTDCSGTIWLAGMTGMALWGLLSWYKLNRRVAEAIPEGNNLYRCDHIDSPFVLGLVRPRIYLPTALSPEDASHVIAHEQAHIRRRDHWWKPLGFLVLTIHWFNPAVWAAYILLCRDIELACDERVIQDLGTEAKAAYSRALLRCAARSRTIAACPVAFGEVGIKKRVQNVLHYKHPAFWVLAASLVVCAAVAVCFLTDPPEDPPAPAADLTQLSDLQNRVTVANPLSSAHPRTYTDPVVVERVHDMFENLTWTEAPDADLDLKTWLSVGLMYSGEHYSLHLDRSGTGYLHWLRGEEQSAVTKLHFDRNTYDFDYLWLLYTGSSQSADVHTDLYTGGALLYQSLALSFLPADGSTYAQVLESGEILTIYNKDCKALSLGRRISEKHRSRAQMISNFSSLPEYNGGFDALFPKDTESVTVRVYEDEEENRFSIWQLDFEERESWLWLAEGGEEPLRLYELINLDETLQFGVEAWLWTQALTSPTLPLRFDGKFTSAAISVSTGTISNTPLPATGFHQPASSLSDLSVGESVYWLLPDADTLQEDPVLSYTFTLENGNIIRDSIKLRRLSRAESLYGSVTFGVSQDWLGLLSSQAHMAQLSASEDFHGLTVTMDADRFSSMVSTPLVPSFAAP